MTLDIDKYLQKTHHITEYNCWDFIRDVWMDLTGRDIGKRTPDSGTRAEMKVRFAAEESHFVKLAAPEYPCIVLFKRRRLLPHVGILLATSVGPRVLHLAENSMGKLEPLDMASMGFREIGYFKW